MILGINHAQWSTILCTFYMWRMCTWPYKLVFHLDLASNTFPVARLEILTKVTNWQPTDFYHGVATSSRRKILLRVFQSNLWALLCIFQAPLSQSLWSGYHWKDVYLLQKLNIEDANFDQRWWHQKWNKSQSLSQLVIGRTGVKGLIRPRVVLVAKLNYMPNFIVPKSLLL